MLDRIKMVKEKLDASLSELGILSWMFSKQRSKIVPEAFSTLFGFFVQKTQPFRFYKGYRLFAADGSDIQIPNNPSHSSSHYPSVNGSSINLAV